MHDISKPVFWEKNKIKKYFKMFAENFNPAYKVLMLSQTGYAALFRHCGDELNFCCYIIPGNPKCTPENLAYWHDYIIKEDQNISRALGNNFKMERMKAASLRLGGEKVTYDKHCLLIGDAAGMIDPLTGMKSISATCPLWFLCFQNICEVLGRKSMSS